MVVLLTKLHGFKPIKNYYKLKNGLNPENIKYILVINSKETDKHKPIVWDKEFNTFSSYCGGPYINYDSNLADNLTLNDKTDAQIDAMVYELYGLNEEEIKILEGNL